MFHVIEYATDSSNAAHELTMAQVRSRGLALAS